LVGRGIFISFYKRKVGLVGPRTFGWSFFFRKRLVGLGHYLSE